MSTRLNALVMRPRRPLPRAVFAACGLAAVAAVADEPVPRAARPVVIQQFQGNANGFQLQVQVQVQGAAAAAVPVPPPEVAAAGAAEDDAVEIDVIGEDVVEFGFPEIAFPFGADAGGRAPPGGIAGAVGDMLRAALGVRGPALGAAPAEAADPAAPAEGAVNPARAAELQRQAQIKQQAKQFEQLMQPVLRAELELIRAACGELPPEARRAILAKGRDAVTKAALAFATRQMNGEQGRQGFDPRAQIREELASVVRKQASPKAFAAYDRERQRRGQRRAEAARVRTISRLDSQLELTAEQRAAIERDLEGRWQAGWNAVLDDQGMVVNGRPLAPDFCDAAVGPHLGDAQRRQWDEWRKASGTEVVGWGWAGGMGFDGQGLQHADDWWSK